MQEGTVKFFDSTKGFGFIKATSNGEEFFVHSSGLIDDIQDNDLVQFDTTVGSRGINAINVKLIQ